MNPSDWSSDVCSSDLPYLRSQRILDPDVISSLFIRPNNHMDSSSSISTGHPRSSEEFDNPVTPDRQSRLPDYESFSSPVVPGAFTHSSPQPVRPVRRSPSPDNWSSSLTPLPSSSEDSISNPPDSPLSESLSYLFDPSLSFSQHLSADDLPILEQSAAHPQRPSSASSSSRPFNTLFFTSRSEERRVGKEC